MQKAIAKLYPGVGAMTGFLSWNMLSNMKEIKKIKIIFKSKSQKQ